MPDGKGDYWNWQNGIPDVLPNAAVAPLQPSSPSYLRQGIGTTGSPAVQAPMGNSYLNQGINNPAASLAGQNLPQMASAVGGIAKTLAGASPIGIGGAIAGAVIPSIFSAINGIGQRRQAKRIRANAVDPGFMMNQGVLQNADTLQNHYNNYQIPGYNQALNNINASGATAFSSGLQGASSSGDVLDLATRIAYGTGQQYRGLAQQNAQGKEGALQDYLGANVAAGDQQQQANAYQRQKYQQQLAEAAALYNAGDQNVNSGITGASSIATSALLNPRRRPPANLYG